MATTLSFLTDPAYRPVLRHGPATLVASLALGTAPWLERDWLASVGALPDNFAVSGRPGGGEPFHELFAATGMDCCLGAAITFYSPFDDMIHLTSWTEAESARFYRDWVHELTHATGHPSRLGRDLPGVCGSVFHGMEDLIAEIAAAIVCLDLGISPGLRHPACCPVWIALLRAEPQAFACAVRHAREAAAYLFHRRDLQAEAYARLAAEELQAVRAERARDAVARRPGWLAERERGALRCATVRRLGERSPAHCPGGSL
ncbi:zincin-like metallopeptidase domain-containing protein [Sphingomonas sp. AR_OL41]|uniref:zincin-like metallopeptidase domain-containing protein n=1 Tax=Sphingomonas sp. AR_OL41 TaxID=3042729 RepID=UPI00248083C6|nr:zincin-like metallopeptidase domain-containing protein [Sphingomonas sp. AR_OL41]MDH7973922.1 zincin-like metallopeptidase domain-containing protein [Sphingomonas sp. AR_OL41]